MQVSASGIIFLGDSTSSAGVAPYYSADINPEIAGTVRYTQFTTTDYTQMSRVSTFIQNQTDNSFYGTSMMVAEWDGVVEYFGDSVSSAVLLQLCLVLLPRVMPV